VVSVTAEQFHLALAACDGHKVTGQGKDGLGLNAGQPQFGRLQGHGDLVCLLPVISHDTRYSATSILS
jgi:hypothetical protein